MVHFAFEIRKNTISQSKSGAIRLFQEKQQFPRNPTHENGPEIQRRGAMS